MSEALDLVCENQLKSDMQTVFHKSQKGAEEIASRAHGLSARLRRCLILIDGKRTLSDLKTVLSSDDVDQMLVELLEADLIEGNAPPAVVIPVLMPSFAEDTEPPSEFDSLPTLTPSAPAVRRPLSLQERRHRGVRIVQDVLGPMAEDIAVKIERCQDDLALNAALEKAYGYIKELSSKAAAEKFRGDVRLPPY